MASLTDSFIFHIAGIKVKIGGSDKLDCLRYFPGYDVFASQGDFDFSMEFTDGDFPEPKGEIVYDVNMDVHRSVLYSDNDSVGFRMFLKSDGSLAAGFDYSRESRLANAWTGGDAQALHFTLWMAFNAFGASLLTFGVHSSCIATPQGAVLFLGESGTGKSTHTGLWIKNFPDAYLLNDDSPFIECSASGIYACGSVWSGKTPCFLNERLPLKAAVRLRQAPENKMRRLGTLEAFTALYPSFPPAFAKVPFLREKLMQAVSAFIANVPVYFLDCLPDRATAELSRKTVFDA